MEAYSSVQVLELRAGASAKELETLAASGLLEIQRWIAGVERLALLQLGGEPARYVLITTFVNHEAYLRWRRVEEEGPDYWERYAAIMMRWEQLCRQLDVGVGKTVLDISISQGA